MPENSGKKDAITSFLRRVAQGRGLIEEIWVDREVQRRGSKSECSQGNSLSGNQIHTITGLLQDDLKYCFYDESFIFRVIAADPGSGKTAVLKYLSELSQSALDCTQRKVIPIFWSLNNLTTIPGNSNFGLEFYSSLIVELFSSAFCGDSSLSDTAKDFLLDFFDTEEFNSIVKQGTVVKFRKGKLRKALLESNEDLLELFLNIVQHFSTKSFGLLFLIDELDSLYKSNQAKDAVNIFRNLINQVDTSYGCKLPLGFYISGLSDDVVSLGASH